MHTIDTAYIDGSFVPTGGTVADIVNPATEAPIGRVRLADRDDARRAIAAARRAQDALASTSKTERVEMLRRLGAAVLARSDDIREATIQEYGAPLARARFVSEYASQAFADAARTLEDYEFTRPAGRAIVRMDPVGVSALIAPWNSAAGTIASKLASALAAACASIIKPSELSPIQAHIMAEAFHAAELPPGVVNLVVGTGAEVGDEFSVNPDVARISFTGSTTTGKIVARAAAGGLKRVGLSLSGKSASIILDDADLAVAVPLALDGGFNNNGQACIAGARILVPRALMSDVVDRVKAHVAQLCVGDPRNPATTIGPLANRMQFDRIQHYIRRGLEQGANLIAGGVGRPDGLTSGYFARPTVFADVHNDMDIAREEIFGPVLVLIPYETDAEAANLANDSPYGLQAYVFSRQRERALRLADRLHAGSVLVNTIRPDLLAPFGGVKQSGLGREFGVFGLESFLEPKSIIVE